MLIKFGFGAILFGPTLFSKHRAGITVMLGRRNAPPDEWQWRHVWHLSWTWPKRVYRPVRKRLHWNGKVHPDAALIDEIDSSRWTGQDEEFVRFDRGSLSKWTIHTTREAKMFIYLNGQKERNAAEYKMYVAPANLVGPNMSANDVPADWYEDGRARTFKITFHFGKAEVPEMLGELLIKSKMAARTKLIVAGTSLLGGLARKLTTQGA